MWRPKSHPEAKTYLFDEAVLTACREQTDPHRSSQLAFGCWDGCPQCPVTSSQGPVGGVRCRCVNIRGALRVLPRRPSSHWATPVSGSRSGIPPPPSSSRTSTTASPTTASAATSRPSYATTSSSSTRSASPRWTAPATNCCSASPPPPTNAAASPSPATGPSRTGAASYPTTAPPSACSTASCTTTTSSPPTARATGCEKPHPPRRPPLEALTHTRGGDISWPPTGTPAWPLTLVRPLACPRSGQGHTARSAGRTLNH